MEMWTVQRPTHPDNISPEVWPTPFSQGRVHSSLPFRLGKLGFTYAS